jgi:ligand-binding sensor domain-containing protein
VAVLAGIIFAGRAAVCAEPRAPQIPERPLRIRGVSEITETADGTIAFGSCIGLALWREGKLTAFSGPDGRGRPGNSALPGSYVHSMIAGRDGSLWVGMWGGLARVKDGKVRDVTPRIRTILQAGDAQGRHRFANNPDVMCLFEASDGRILIGMRSADLVVYTPDREKYESIALSPDLGLEEPPDENNWIKSIAEDREKRLWTCITDLGMYQIDGLEIKNIPAERKSWKKVDDPEVLCFDSRDNLWIGTDTGQLELHAPDGSRRVFTDKEGLPAGVTEIHEDSPGAVWVTTWSGACLHDGKEFHYAVLDGESPQTLFKSRSGKYWSSDGMRVVCTSEVKWISTPPLEQKIARVKTRVETEYPDVRPDTTTVVDRQGRVWVLADRLIRFDGKKWTDIPEVTSSSVMGGTLWVDSKGRVLVGTSDGFWICEGDQQSLVSRDDGWPVYEMAESRDGVIYVGSQCGLLALKGAKFERLTNVEFLQPVHLAIDSTGAVWFADPNFGLCRFVDGKMTWFTEQVRLAGYEVEALEPLPKRGVRIHVTSQKLIDPVAKAFEFDGRKVIEVPPPRPMLGLNGHDHPRGCVVDKVFPHSAAARAKIGAGDVISEFDGRPIGGITQLTEAVRGLWPGETVAVGIIRKDRPLKVKVVLTKWP